MSHEIAIIDGKASMAYAGNKEDIWHGLGQELTPDAPIEVWKTEAGMNWEILKSGISFNKDQIYAGSQILYRSDTLDQLSIVSNSYKIVQPAEVLEFFQDLVGAAGMKLSTAGVLFGGRRFWALADTNNFGHINGNDAIKGNLLLTTSCDGTLATTASLVATRVVCNNTLRVALTEGSNMIRVNHSRQFDPRAVKEAMGLINEPWEKFIAKVTTLSETAISEEKAHQFIYDLVAKPGKLPEDQPFTTYKTVDAILNKFKTGMGNNGETLWDLVNGFTEHYGHDMGRTKKPDVKLWNNFYGNDANIKDLAFEKAYSIATN